MNGNNQSTNAMIYARGMPEAVERQLHVCRDYAAKQGLAVDGEIVDFKSAGEIKSLQLKKLLEQVDEQHPDVVIVTDLSRLSRNIGELMAFQNRLAERNVQIVTVASPA